MNDDEKKHRKEKEPAPAEPSEELKQTGDEGGKETVMPQAGSGDEMKPSDVRAESEALEKTSERRAGERKAGMKEHIASPEQEVVPMGEAKKPAKAGMRRGKARRTARRAARGTRRAAIVKKMSKGMAKRSEKRQARSSGSKKQSR